MKKTKVQYNIDFRKRCLKPNGHFDRIYYGHTAAEYDDPGADKVIDIVDDFDHSKGRGRAPGQPAEQERQTHFFNRRIM